MNPALPPEKRRIAFAVLLAVMLLLIGTGAAVFWQDWLSTRVADLPSSFWLLYIADIIIVIALFLFFRFYLQTPISQVRNTNPVLAGFYVLIGISQFVQLLTAPDPKGSLILLGTIGIFLALSFGSELIRYIRARLDNQKPSRN